MMRNRVALIVLLSFSFWANANDSEAIRIAGQLEFKKNNAIAMLSEDLLISSDKVRVTYIFHNESSQDIEALVAFPIQEAIWEAWEDIDLADLVKQINFKLTSTEVTSTVSHEAKITSDHIAHVIFHWKQKFPAGKMVTVSHEYEPSGGFITPTVSTDERWSNLIDQYCIEPKLHQWILRHERGASEVHYILTTGANWKTPIQHFKLTIQKDTPTQRVSLCADNIQKINAITFRLEQDNFLPTRDLKVLFINP